MSEKKFTDLQKMSPAELLQEIQQRRHAKTSNLVASNPYEQFLIGVWNEFFPNAAFDLNTGFFSLGGTSIQAVLLLSKIKTHYNIEIGLLDLFKRATIAKQAMLIQETLQNKKISITEYDYQQDVNLVQHINWSGVKPLPKTINTILVTGASGFLGLHLLKELLVTTDAHIICLVRGNSVAEATVRLLQSAQKNKIVISAAEEKRIQCFCGDMSLPQLGLSEENYQYLTEYVDLIIHSAAVVNFVYSYEQLRPTNVLGFVELVTLASTYKLKPIHLISTIGVFNNQFDTLAEVNENTELSAALQPNGYFQTKWVIEKIAALVKGQGLPVAIYRPSGISMNSKSGVISPDDLTYQLMKLSLAVGAFADLKSLVDVVTVDYVAESVIKLVRNHPFASTIYHLTSGDVLSSKELIQQLPKGNAIKILSFDEYIKKATELVNTTEDPQLHQLGPLLISGLMANANTTEKFPQFNSKFTDSLLETKKKPRIKEIILAIIKFGQL